MATLRDLSPGTTATLSSVSGTRAHRRRLLELGLVPGTPVRLVRRSSLQDLLEVEARGSRISLRASEAGLIQVEAPHG